MKQQLPQFGLQRVADGDTDLSPAIVPLTARRDFLGAGLSAAAALWLTGCAPGKSEVSEPPVTIKAPTSELKAHHNGVSALALTANGQTLASASDMNVKIWDLQTGRITTTLKLDAEAKAMALTADGQKLAAVIGKQIKIWSLAQGEVWHVVPEPVNRVGALALSPDGQLIAFDDDSTLNLWSPAQSRLLQKVEGAYADALAISADGRRLAMHTTAVVKFYSLPDLREQKESFLCGVGMGSDIGLTSDGKRIAASVLLDDKVAKVWDAVTQKVRLVLEGHQTYLRAVALAADGQTMATADLNGVILLWDLREPRFRSVAYDRTETDSKVKGINYKARDLATGQMIGYTVPCSESLPIAASCVCNCVAGTYNARTAQQGRAQRPRARVTQDSPVEYRPLEIARPQLQEVPRFERRIEIPRYEPQPVRPIEPIQPLTPGGTFKKPCGAPVPPGMKCTCNCIPGNF
ncbi:MAG: hypothetical protein ABI977_11745 [Acidobacteriota bacterium]